LDITGVYQAAEKTLAVSTAERSAKLQPLLIRFNADSAMDEFQADLVHG